VRFSPRNPAEASWEPSGDHAKAPTPYECPNSDAAGGASGGAARAHTRTAGALPRSPTASHSPSGDQLMDATGRSHRYVRTCLLRRASYRTTRHPAA